MGTELVQASWSSLEPSERKHVFSQVMTRIGQVLSTRNVRHLTSHALDRYLPDVIEAMEKKNEPAGEQVAKQAVELACQMLRCKKPEDAALKGYIAVLAKCPADLLMNSIGVAIEKETHHVLPTPGALLAAARPKREEREAMIANARFARERLKISEDFRKRGIGMC